MVDNARERIFANVRRSLGREGELSAARRDGLQKRLTNPETHVQPRLPADRVQRFRVKLEAAGGSVDEVSTLAHVAPAVVEYLKRQQLPPTLVTSSDALMTAIEWPELVTTRSGPAKDSDRVSVTSAVAGVAETGTLMLLSSQQSPTTLNFLPDHHIVVIEHAKLVAHLEDAWRVLRTLTTTMPRTVNLISGPSKTADVEQTLQLGAHGPRCLHVILVAGG